MNVTVLTPASCGTRSLLRKVIRAMRRFNVRHLFCRHTWTIHTPRTAMDHKGRAILFDVGCTKCGHRRSIHKDAKVTVAGKTRS